MPEYQPFPERTRVRVKILSHEDEPFICQQIRGGNAIIHECYPQIDERNYFDIGDVQDGDALIFISKNLLTRKTEPV